MNTGKYFCSDMHSLRTSVELKIERILNRKENCFSHVPVIVVCKEENAVWYVGKMTVFISWKIRPLGKHDTTHSTAHQVLTSY